VRVVIIGTGYVGPVSGACFADFGHHVTCVDKDTAKVATLQAGTIPIYEPGLEEIVRINIAAGRLAFTSELADSVPDSDVVMIAVGTAVARW
jgi:UDPglucose 6-dehydrogenase